MDRYKEIYMFMFFHDPEKIIKVVTNPTLPNLVNAVIPTPVHNVVKAVQSPTPLNILRAIEPPIPIGHRASDIVRDFEQISRNPSQFFETAGTIVIRDIVISPMQHELIYNIVSGILMSLKSQASNKWKSIPAELIRILQPHYAANLNEIKYAENINTPVKDNAITFPNEIYFPRQIDPLANKNDLHWLLHELTHEDQYIRVGGMRNFLRNYSADSLLKIITKGTFDVHDHLTYEKEADERADNILENVWHELNNLRPGRRI